MQITGAVALVTGANRGLGREFARQLVERGATVYATARRPETLDLEGVVPLCMHGMISAITFVGSPARRQHRMSRTYSTASAA